MRKFFTDRTPPDRTKLASIYDSHASTWLQREGSAKTRLTSEKWQKDLVALLHGDVLEIGMAAGDVLKRLDKYDHAVTSFTGIDISRGMIEQARGEAHGIPIPVSLDVVDAEDLSRYEGNAFDTVTASLVFCTIPDVPKALSEIARVIRPGGRLVLIEHVLSQNRFVGKIQKLVAPFQIRAMGCHLDRTTIETLEQSGFHIEEERRRIFGIMRFVIARPPA